MTDGAASQRGDGCGRFETDQLRHDRLEASSGCGFCSVIDALESRVRSAIRGRRQGDPTHGRDTTIAEAHDFSRESKR